MLNGKRLWQRRTANGKGKRNYHLARLTHGFAHCIPAAFIVNYWSKPWPTENQSIAGTGFTHAAITMR